MTKPIIKLHNAETNEVIEREMSDEEFAQFEQDNALRAERKAAENAKLVEKAALLTKLGITAEEAKLLLS